MTHYTDQVLSVTDVVKTAQGTRELVPPDVTWVTTGQIAATTPIVVDVTDLIGLGQVIVLVRQGSAYEVAWDGVSWSYAYSSLSTRTEISDGFRFTLARSGGWIASPTIVVRATDAAGNTA